MDDRTVYRNQRTIDMTDGVDQGLRAYMIQVFNYMAIGLGITGIVAFALSNSPQLMAAIWGTGLHWVVMLAPLPWFFS